MKKKIKKSLLSFLVVALLVGNLFFPFLASASPAIIFEDGFESGDFSAWTAYSGSTVITSPVYQGTYAAQNDLNTDYFYKNVTAQNLAYVRAYVRWATNPPSGNWMTFFSLRSLIDAKDLLYLKVYNIVGTIKWQIVVYKSDSTWETVTFDTPNPTTNTWYSVEVKWERSTAGGVSLWVDGNLVGSNTETTYDAGVERLRFQTGTPTHYIDSIVVADAYIGCNPNNPSSLGPTNYVNGSWISDKTPTLQFTQSDPDSGDTVRYRTQIDNNSDFSSPVVDYTSDYISQGATSFTVGQAPGTGTYTQGSQGQTLTNGSYYWQVMSEDQNTNQSSWTQANSGNVAFKLSIAKIYTGVTNTIYANGTVSYSQQPSENNLINFNIVPSYGSVTLTILTWQTSGDYLKEWTEDASQPGIVTDHTVGDLKPNTSYNILVDNTLFTKKTSDTTGEITFLYDGGYSEKNFKIEQTPEELAPTGYNISYLFYLLPLIFFLIGYTLYKTGPSLVR